MAYLERRNADVIINVAQTIPYVHPTIVHRYGYVLGGATEVYDGASVLPRSPPEGDLEQRHVLGLRVIVFYHAGGSIKGGCAGTYSSRHNYFWITYND